LVWTLRSFAPPASTTSRYPCVCMCTCMCACVRVCVCVCGAHECVRVCVNARECARVSVCTHAHACCSCQGGRPMCACYAACAAALCMEPLHSLYIDSIIHLYTYSITRIHTKTRSHTHASAHACIHINAFYHLLTLFNQVANRPGSFYNTSLNAGEVTAVGGVPFGFTSYNVPGGGHGRLLTILQASSWHEVCRPLCRAHVGVRTGGRGSSPVQHIPLYGNAGQLNTLVNPSIERTLQGSHLFRTPSCLISTSTMSVRATYLIT